MITLGVALDTSPARQWTTEENEERENTARIQGGYREDTGREPEFVTMSLDSGAAETAVSGGHRTRRDSVFIAKKTQQSI